MQNARTRGRRGGGGTGMPVHAKGSQRERSPTPENWWFPPMLNRLRPARVSGRPRPGGAPGRAAPGAVGRLAEAGACRPGGPLPSLSAPWYSGSAFAKLACTLERLRPDWPKAPPPQELVRLPTSGEQALAPEFGALAPRDPELWFEGRPPRSSPIALFAMPATNSSKAFSRLGLRAELWLGAPSLLAISPCEAGGVHRYGARGSVRARGSIPVSRGSTRRSAHHWHVGKALRPAAAAGVERPRHEGARLPAAPAAARHDALRSPPREFARCEAHARGAVQCASNVQRVACVRWMGHKATGEPAGRPAGRRCWACAAGNERREQRGAGSLAPFHLLWRSARQTHDSIDRRDLVINSEQDCRACVPPRWRRWVKHPSITVTVP